MVPVGSTLCASPIRDGLVQSIAALLVGPMRNPSEHLPFPPHVLLQHHRMRTPDHSHSRSSPCLDPRHAVLEYKAFLGVDDGLPLGYQVFVDTL